MIRERRKGVWQVVVYVGRDPVTKKERHLRRTVHGTKTKARELERRLKVDVGDGRLVGTEETMNDLLARWLELAAPNLSPKTVYTYRRLIERHIAPALGTLKLSKVTPARIDAFYAHLRATLSPKSVRNAHGIVRRACAQAVRWGWIATNPAADATPPPLRQPEIHPPAPAEVAGVIDAAQRVDPDFAMFLWLAATTGARRGELAALQWRDIDFDAGELVVERALVAVSGELIVKDTKTHQARRIALGVPTIARLREHRARALERATTGGYELGPMLWLFPSPAGTPWHPDTISARYRRLAKAAGVSTRFHDLRHFAATQAIGTGHAVRTVSGRLGHRNPATTHNVYSHFLKASDREVAEQLEDLLAG